MIAHKQEIADIDVVGIYSSRNTVVAILISWINAGTFL